MLDTFIVEQVQTFALTVGLGILIGFFFDCVRAVRSCIRFSRKTEFFLDIVFWFIMTMLVFVSLLSRNWGEVRAYIFIGLITGGLFYALTLSRPLYNFMIKVLAALRRLAFFLARPLIYLLATARRLLQWVKRIIGRVSERIKKLRSALVRKKKE